MVLSAREMEHCVPPIAVFVAVLLFVFSVAFLVNLEVLCISEYLCVLTLSLVGVVCWLLCVLELELRVPYVTGSALH